jgi:tetratricopeptide (TPR) repeat protein
VLVLGSVISIWQAIRATRAERLAAKRLDAETQARRDADSARNSAVSERDRANANLQKALKGMQEILLCMAPEFEQSPETTGLRRTITEYALGVIQGFLQNSSDAPSLRFETAEAHGYLASIYDLAGRHADAHAADVKCSELLAQLTNEFPDDPYYHHQLGHAHCRMSGTLQRLGHHEAADDEYRHAIRSFRRAVELAPDDSRFLNNLAWTLGSRPEPAWNDPHSAIPIAKRATDIDPAKASRWHTLGVIQYRAGRYADAIGSLERSAALKSGGDSFDWFFLTMAHWQLGEHQTARTWYARAVEWMDQHRSADPSLRLWREEAALLLDQ